jgi:penicillin-binding protein 1A
MPIWAYFMHKAANDASCGIDTKLTFTKPEEINTDFQIDYTNGNVPIQSGESEIGISGAETGYDVTEATEVIGAESDTTLLGNKPKSLPASGNLPKPVENKPPANLPTPPKNPPPPPKKTGNE